MVKCVHTWLDPTVHINLTLKATAALKLRQDYYYFKTCLFFKHDLNHLIAASVRFSSVLPLQINPNFPLLKRSVHKFPAPSPLFKVLLIGVRVGPAGGRKVEVGFAPNRWSVRADKLKRHESFPAITLSRDYVDSDQRRLRCMCRINFKKVH